MSMAMEGMGIVKTMVNGKLIEEKAIEGHYNGKNLELSTILNRPLQNIHEHKSYRLSNDDIMKLMSMPSNKTALDKRLIKDFEIKNRKSKSKTKRKSNKSKSKKKI
jgi:hypothetical protein